MIQFEKDLDIFFKGEFSKTATYIHGDSPGVEVEVIDFLEPTDLGDSFFYTMFSKATYFQTIERGDKFLLDGENYVVRDYNVDELGLVIELLLNKEGMR